MSDKAWLKDVLDNAPKYDLAGALQELTRLRAENDQLQHRHGELVAQLLKRETENEQLRKALEPLAMLSKTLHWTSPALEYCRRAAELLNRHNHTNNPNNLTNKQKD